MFMPEKFKVEMVTPKGVILDRQVEEIIAPGIMGEFGVLIGHTPLLTFIKPGVFSYLEDDKFTRFVVGPGFCEVLRDSVTVLVEEAYAEEDIDPTLAADELAAAEEQLRNTDPAVDPLGYERLSNKLRVARTKVMLSGGG
jgi:F-type H+-transporting ATPase subunit epsilon